MNGHDDTIVLEELKSVLLEKIGKDSQEQCVERISSFVQMVRQRYGTYQLQTTQLYHLLLGSSPASFPIERFDLPDGEIEHFIREEL